MVLSLSRRIPRDQVIHQARLLDLRRMAALGDHDLPDSPHRVGRPDRAGDVGEDAVVGAPDHEGRVRRSATAARPPSGRPCRGASGGRPSSTGGPGTSGGSACTSSSEAKWSLVEHRLDQRLVIAATNALDHRQVFVAVESRRADQDQLARPSRDARRHRSG